MTATTIFEPARVWLRRGALHGAVVHARATLHLF
jgi:hypothetical protein